MRIEILNLIYYKDKYMRKLREYIVAVKHRKFWLRKFGHK